MWLSQFIYYLIILGGGAHWVLMWHLTRRGLYHCLMPDYAWRCRTSTLIMVPINFWRNSDPFKKKEHFSSSKTDRVNESIFCQSYKFSIVNLSNRGQKYLKQSRGCHEYLSITHNTFDPLFQVFLICDVSVPFALFKSPQETGIRKYPIPIESMT